MPKTDPEIAAYARTMNFEEESEDIIAFLKAYPRATGETLELVDLSESPDAIRRRPDGALLGLGPALAGKGALGSDPALPR